MKLKIHENAIYDENGTLVGVVSKDASSEVRNVIEASGDLVEAVREFIANANKGNFKPKASVNRFELVLTKNNIQIYDSDSED